MQNAAAALAKAPVPPPGRQHLARRPLCAITCPPATRELRVSNQLVLIAAMADRQRAGRPKFVSGTADVLERKRKRKVDVRASRCTAQRLDQAISLMLAR